ncbi:MAG: dynamin family protein [Deltaproteobacteria bacterium]|nr:dynamin family protein [Deltaproteobacteria bacterium]
MQDKDSYIDSLRRELLFLIEKKLSPIALKYNYADVPLESKIKWKPLVLVLGNYSSGKSTLINEFVGAKIQTTGQAPTDDSFTVITCDEDDEKTSHLPEGAVYETRDGNVLLNDETYPFELLKKYGDRFASHFRLKKVNSKLLKNLAIIDTPGMLDSASEKGRSYNFQGAIGDLALLSDLVLVLFDPHKAGTIKESHFSLKETLPEKTFDDRVIFVLNRIDECTNLDDLLRVYGTLCWNLSFMTGRKDIPPILLTYSPSVSHTKGEQDVHEFLTLLENQRNQLTNVILDAPRHRLDHLASFVEYHSRRLSHLLEELIHFEKEQRAFRWRLTLLGFTVSLFAGALVGVYAHFVKPWGEFDEPSTAAIAGGVAVVLYAIWHIAVVGILAKFKFSNAVRELHEDTRTFASADRMDTWKYVRQRLIDYLESEASPASLATLKKERELVDTVHNKGARELRNAINKINEI